MKKLLTFLSFTIFTFSIISCSDVNKEKDFFQKKFNTENIEIITEVTTDSAYSPHVETEELYRITHKGLTEENFDSLFHCYLHVRRQFINPTHNNCIKKTFAVKVDKGEPQIHSIYYVSHRGGMCMHDREMIMRQLSDIDHNFYYFKKDKKKFIEIIMNDTCKIEKKF
jgi:hypothetical protein